MAGHPAHPAEPIRVLRLITRLNIGGPAIQAITLSDRLTARGFRTVLVHGRLSAGEGNMAERLPSGVDAIYLPTLQRRVAPIDDARAVAALCRLLYRVRPAIIHTHTAKAGTIGRLAAAIHNRTAGRRAPVRVVHTYHGHVLDGYFGPVATRCFTSAERQLARLTDAIVAISLRIKTELLVGHRIGREAQYHVVPLGFDLTPLLAVDDVARQAARSALGIPTGAHVVSTVGRLTAIKQHRLFLETAQRIGQRDASALFIIAGDGELRQQLEASARTLGLEQRTRFLGWRRDLPTIYAATDVFLLTSRSEGTPVALIESLAAGVPAVSTDVGGVRDVIDSSDAGLLAPFGDADALAAAVGALLADRSRRRAMGEHGRGAMLARYTLDRLVDDVEGLYRELLARSHSLPAVEPQVHEREHL
jgi:glycosyltransferase involved in cell wall biosynthesis